MSISMDATKNNPPVPPSIAITIGILAASTSSIFIRYAQQDASSLVIAAYRLGLATLLLTPIALLNHHRELRALTLPEFGLGILSGSLLAVHFATWITSLEYTTVASSIVLVSTTPLWVTLLSPLILREHIARFVTIGMLVALAGGAIIGLSDACMQTGAVLVCPPINEFIQGEAFFGDLLALAGALSGAGYLIIGRRLRAKTSLIPYIYVVYGIAAVVLVLFSLSTRQPFLGYSPVTYLWFILLALVPQLIGHTTYNWALRYVSAAYVSITLLGEPISSTLLAYLLLSEVPSTIKLFGAILILTGIYIASKSEAHRSSNPVQI